MKKKIITSSILIIVVIISAYFIYFNKLPVLSSGEPPGFEIVATNLDTPWSIAFLPDETLIFTERNGNVGIVKNKKVTRIATIVVSEVSESGLSGIAIDPNFLENNFLYLYYTSDTGNRVSRFIFTNSTLSEETILLNNIPSARHHDGGRIKFGPDGKLYITTGDASNPSSAQDLASLSGKILRMNKDGTIPADNPYKNYVYSYGHRNPQGIAWDEKGNMYSSEHGPTRNDEINLIIKGANYGWPQECDEEGDFTNPIKCFTEFTLAPASLTFFKNNLYIPGLKGSQIRKLTIENNEVIAEVELINNLGRLREAVLHNGFLYFSTSNNDGRGIPRRNDDKIYKMALE